MSVEHPRAWAIDVDLTTVNTEKVFDRTVRLCEDMSLLDPTVLAAARLLVEQTGGSFDTFSYLRSVGVGPKDLTELSQRVGDSTYADEYKYPDTDRLFEYIDACGDVGFSLTYGNPVTQMPKLTASRLAERPYVITDKKYKGPLIGSWCTPDGYEILMDNGQVLHAASIVEVDDKSLSFIDLPEDCIGYRVWHSETPKLSQLGDLPPHVTAVGSLDEIIAIDRARTS